MVNPDIICFRQFTKGLVDAGYLYLEVHVTFSVVIPTFTVLWHIIAQIQSIVEQKILHYNLRDDLLT